MPGPQGGVDGDVQQRSIIRIERHHSEE
jgi:hypothetical protein